jgi:phenylacetic acid degradation operon negative regulatory protein
MLMAAEKAETVAREDGAPSARSLLLTVVGELMWPRPEAAWTSTLVHVLGGLGVEERAARQAIARASSAGWIEGTRRGREVCWSIAPAGHRLIRDGAKRVTSMSRTRQGWSGQWLIVLVTIPKELRNARKGLYGGLRWAGFGNPTPGVWLSPYTERETEVNQLITDLDLGDHTLSFIGRPGTVGLTDQEIVERSWKIHEAESAFQAILDTHEHLDPAPGDEMLFAHIRVVSQWQRLPFLDPHLPEELLPNWIGRRTAARLEELRQRWAPEVHEHWRRLNATANGE